MRLLHRCVGVLNYRGLVVCLAFIMCDVVILSGFNRICDNFYLKVNNFYLQHIVKQWVINNLKSEPERVHQIEQNC